MNTEIKTITINGKEYIEKSSIGEVPAQSKDGLKHVLVRSYLAGVFFGYLKEETKSEGVTDVVLLDSRRVHYWSGAASLSQLSVDGTSDPKNCRIPVAISEHKIKNVIEILPLTEKAKLSLDKVPLWKV